MILRCSIAIIAALALGCGSAQHSVGPSQEALTDGTQPHHPSEAEKWCPPPPDFPREIMLIVGDTCWVEVVATQAECDKLIRETGRYMKWDNRCYFFRYKKRKPLPTSSAAEPLSPVTTR
jgi:hypothetical protein